MGRKYSAPTWDYHLEGGNGQKIFCPYVGLTFGMAVMGRKYSAPTWDDYLEWR